MGSMGPVSIPNPPWKLPFSLSGPRKEKSSLSEQVNFPQIIPHATGCQDFQKVASEKCQQMRECRAELVQHLTKLDEIPTRIADPETDSGHGSGDRKSFLQELGKKLAKIY